MAILFSLPGNGRPLHRRVRGAELCSSLNAHDGQVQAVARVARRHSVGQRAESVPDGRGGKRIDSIGQTERNRHLAEAGIEGDAIEIAEQGVGTPHLKLVALKIRVGARAEVLFRVVEDLRMAGDPIAEHGRETQLRGMDRRLGYLVSHLIGGGRMAHQIGELVGPVARLVVGDRGDRSLDIQAVRREGPFPVCARELSAACD